MYIVNKVRYHFTDGTLERVRDVAYEYFYFTPAGGRRDKIIEAPIERAAGLYFDFDLLRRTRPGRTEALVTLGYDRCSRTYIFRDRLRS